MPEFFEDGDIQYSSNDYMALLISHSKRIGESKEQDLVQLEDGSYTARTKDAQYYLEAINAAKNLRDMLYDDNPEASNTVEYFFRTSHSQDLAGVIFDQVVAHRRASLHEELPEVLLEEYSQRSDMGLYEFINAYNHRYRKLTPISFDDGYNGEVVYPDPPEDFDTSTPGAIEKWREIVRENRRKNVEGKIQLCHDLFRRSIERSLRIDQVGNMLRFHLSEEEKPAIQESFEIAVDDLEVGIGEIYNFVIEDYFDETIGGYDSSPNSNTIFEFLTRIGSRNRIERRERAKEDPIIRWILHLKYRCYFEKLKARLRCPIEA